MKNILPQYTALKSCFVIFTVLFILMCQFGTSKAASYKGVCIDNTSFACSIQDGQTYQWYYNCNVVFDGLEADIYFYDGSLLTVQLEQREIEELTDIHCYNYSPYSQYSIRLTESVRDILNNL